MTQREIKMHALLGTLVHVEVDRPIGYRHGNTVYPINYGYIPGLMAGDGEEQDAYILGTDTPLTSFDGQVVGAVLRKNDCEDKLIVAPVGMRFHQGQISEAVRFQEQYFDTVILSLFRKSCGVLPYRIINGQKEFLLVYQEFSQCWSLPKGHMEPGETEIETAKRELFEETGLTARLDTSISAALEYAISPTVQKQVVLFPGVVEGTPRLQPGETSRFQWVREDALSDYLFSDTVLALKKLIQK